MLKYLFYYAQESINFRLAELNSIAKLLKINFEVEPGGYSDQSPFVVLNLSDEQSAVAILSRSVLIRYCIDIWARSTTYEDLFSQLKKISETKMAAFCKDDYTFKIKIESYNKKVSFSQQKDLIKKLDFLPFNGSVKMNNPDHTFHLLQDFGNKSNSSQEQPSRIFFGRLVGHSQRSILNAYKVTERKFIGNTSMSAELCFLMANQAMVSHGSLVYDPFVGTGSIILACAHFGAYTLGADIDVNLIHGRGRSSRATGPRIRGPDENIYANYCQYDLQSNFVDALILDAAKPAWRNGSFFDAILTDPPYGIREGARKVLSKQDSSFARTSPYNLSKVYRDLLNFAARHLRLYGRLVYWLPVHRFSYTEEMIPKHPCLLLQYNSEQILNSAVSRRLITMEKVKELEDADTANCLIMEEHLQRLQDSFRELYFKLKPAEEYC